MLKFRKQPILAQAFAVAKARLEQILPLSCLLCLQSVKSGLICPICYQDLQQSYPHCQCCGLPLISSASMCGQCIRTPPRFRQLIACGLFSAPLYQLVYQLKYQQQPIFSHVLGQLLAEKVIEQSQPLPQVVLSVPLHPSKERSRGFNQAQLIAQHCSDRLNIPTQPHWLTRVKKTSSQTQLNFKQRKRNLQQAFSVKALPPHIKHVAIVDDIVTTGATVNSLCKELEKVGVSQIEIWCICRTPMHRP